MGVYLTTLLHRISNLRINFSLDITKFPTYISPTMKSRTIEEQASLIRLQDSVDGEIDSILDSIPLRKGATGVLRHEDKRAIIKGLALRKHPNEIFYEVNQLRQEANLPPLQKSQLKLSWYRNKYSEAIERCYNTYASNITRIYTWSDKFKRIGALDDLAGKFKSWIDETPIFNEDYRKNTALFLRILNALHQEMGITRYTVQTTINQTDEKEQANWDQLLERFEGDPKKFIEFVITDRYKDQLGIEDAEIIENHRFRSCAFFIAPDLCSYIRDKCIEESNGDHCEDYVNAELLNDREWLEKRYQKEKLSINTIASLLGRESEPNQVVREMIRDQAHEFGLKRREK